MSDEVKAVDEFIVKYNEFKNEIAKVIVGQEDSCSASFNFYFL